MMNDDDDENTTHAQRLDSIIANFAYDLKLGTSSIFSSENKRVGSAGFGSEVTDRRRLEAELCRTGTVAVNQTKRVHVRTDDDKKGRGLLLVLHYRAT